MKNLSNNWLTEKHIDFEYKKYMLLAYLSEVDNNFEHNRLYPYFSELIEHYKNIVSIRDNKRIISGLFPSRLKKIDLETFNLEYQKIINDDSLLEEIEQIINYSIPKFEHYLNEGKKIYDLIERQINISPVGVIPLNSDYGYLFLQNGNTKVTFIYEYRTTIYEGSEEKYRGIYTQLVESFQKNFTTTYEQIKHQIIRKYKEMPNPATYALETELELPVDETLLPIAKRMLIRHISNLSY
jgi:hypothetical protein